METTFHHFTGIPSAGMRGASEGLIYSELPRGDYQLDASPLGINLVTEGVEIYEIGGARLRVCAGEMLLINAGLPVRVIMEGRSINRAICVRLPQEVATSLAGSAFDWLHRLGAVVVSAATTNLGEELAQHREFPPDQFRANLVMGSVLQHLPRFALTLGSRLQHLPGAKVGTQRSLLQRLDRSYAHISRETRELDSVEKLAEIAGMSSHHFARAFRETYGLPPARLQQQLRMEAAADALTQNQLTVAEAADRFGFADQGSFTRAFQRHLGTSPGKLGRRRLNSSIG